MSVAQPRLAARSSRPAERELDEAAMFVFIGARPRTEMVSGWVELDEKSFVLTGRDLVRADRWPGGWTIERPPFLLETSVPGYSPQATCAPAPASASPRL